MHVLSEGVEVGETMRELDISFGKHRADTNWKTEYLTWDEFVERLRKIRRTPETMEQYDRMNAAQKGRIKDGPAFVGGLIRGGRRKKGNIDTRSLITLDADYADDDFLFTCDLVLGGHAYVIYSTHSHRPHKPKYRLVAPASRNMSPDEYAAVSRKIADQIGMRYFDKTTFNVHQPMYLPSCSKDAEPVLEIYEGEPIDVDAVLSEYEDWRDPAQWPRHDDEKVDRVTPGAKMEDPRKKRGIVGLFCRCYSISEAIAKFLPEVYEPVDDSLKRYTYVGATGFGGLVIYDNDTLAYSHHESDPISGREVNSFDLVRIHKFGRLDENVSEDTPITQLPSYLAMVHYAETLDDIKKLRQKEGSAALQAEFADVFNGTEEFSEKKTALDFSKIKIPFGFKVIGDKLFEIKETKTEIKHIPVCDSLVAVTGRHYNLTDGTYGLDVAWKVGDETKTVTSSRSTFMDSKKIINLADYGFPVHSANARSLASYISRFETENEDLIITEQVSNQMGWVKGGFLLGEKFIGDKPIKFFPKDDGDGQIAKGFHTKGKVEKTYEVLDQTRKYTPVMMAVYAALAAPLVGLLGESPFIFELAGGTSKGKTTALRIAASLYGCPDEQKPGFFKQWNLTKVYIERYAATMNNLPLFIDDTKKADPKIIPPTIYQFCSGQGRGRGSIKGSQIGSTWSTVMLTTGEQKLTSFSKDGGAAARILSLYGSPFESTDLETGNMIERLNETVSENYGHIAEPWIKFLMGIDKSKVREKIMKSLEGYKHYASRHGEVAMRLSRLMALVDVAGQLFDECVNLNLYDEESLQQEWIKILSGSEEIDRPMEALEDVMGWVASHYKQFLKEGEESNFSPIISGRIRKDEVAIIGEQLDAYLVSRGYEPTSIAKAWREKGFLNTEDGRLKKTTRIGPARVKAYCFNVEKTGWSFDLPEKYSEFQEDVSLIL